MNGRRRVRDRLLIAALVFVLAVLSVAAALFESRSDSPIKLDSASSAPDGALALASWLEDLGHSVDTDVQAVYGIPAGTRLVFVLEPAFGAGFSEQELELLDDWVSEGGVLIYAADKPGSRTLPAHFGFDTGYLVNPAAAVKAAGPFFTSPPLTDEIPMEVSSVLRPDIDVFTPLVAVEEGPVVAWIEHGRGKVVLSMSAAPFTNAGLKETGSGAFVLNLLREVPAGGAIWFDEWHHGKRPILSEPAGPGGWLRATSAGRSILFSAGVLFIWLILSGRAFGRPVPLSRKTVRRTPLEYVTAIANLNQRAGNREALVDHYRSRLKRSYGRRFRIDPDLPDDQFLNRLRTYLTPENFETIRRLLEEMSRLDLSEADMVRLANESASQRVSAVDSLTR